MRYDLRIWCAGCFAETGVRRLDGRTVWFGRGRLGGCWFSTVHRRLVRRDLGMDCRCATGILFSGVSAGCAAEYSLLPVEALE